jgi:CheY-like chemotaxis protein
LTNGPTHPTGEPGHPDCEKLRILIVDDHHDAADMLAMMLRLGGYVTMTAYDGLEAVERARAEHPDVVLLDINLPGIDGFEAARRIRATEHGDKVRLAALTGWKRDGDQDRAKEAGFDALMIKPVSYEELEKLIRH